MERTLVWHQGALGDLILSLPAIYAIKTGLRPAHLHLISRTDIARIIIENRLADVVSSNENGLFADFFMQGELSHQAAAFLKEFTSAFIFAKRIDYDFVNNLKRHIPKCLLIPTRPGEGGVTHVSISQVALLSRLGVSVEKMPPLHARPAVQVLQRERPVIAIHPGSGWKKKCWPLGRFLEVMKLLDSEKRFYSYFILGPAEDAGIHERSVRLVAANRIEASVVTGMSVTEVASLLKSSSLYIGNDSGITHLASALGVPTLAVFGPTDPGTWGPFGDNTRIFYSGHPCSPCSDTDLRQCARIRCLEDVNVDQVLAAARDVLLRLSLQ